MSGKVRTVYLDIDSKGLVIPRFTNIPETGEYSRICARNLSDFECRRSAEAGSDADQYLRFRNDDTMRKVLEFLRQASQNVELFTGAGRGCINPYASWLKHKGSWDMCHAIFADTLIIAK